MRVILTLVLLVVGLCGLGISLCGTWVTVLSLADLKGSGELLAVSVPSIAVGAFVVWRVRVRWRELQQADLDSEHE